MSSLISELAVCGNNHNKKAKDNSRNLEERKLLYPFGKLSANKGTNI